MLSAHRLTGVNVHASLRTSFAAPGGSALCALPPRLPNIFLYSTLWGGLPGSTRGRAQPGNGRPAVAYVGAMPRISGVQTTEKLDLSLALSSNGGAAGLVAQWELAEGLEAPVQILYLSALLGFLVVGVYLIVRQVLIRRELEEAAKVLGERLRTGTASPEVPPALPIVSPSHPSCLYMFPWSYLLPKCIICWWMLLCTTASRTLISVKSQHN